MSSLPVGYAYKEVWESETIYISIIKCYVCMLMCIVIAFKSIKYNLTFELTLTKKKTLYISDVKRVIAYNEFQTMSITISYVS